MLRFKYLIILFFSIFAIHFGAQAEPDLLKAMEAWEDGKFNRAAKLFEPFAKGNPVAEPYIQDLLKREVFDRRKLPTTFSEPPLGFVKRAWIPFRTSQRIQLFLSLKKQNRESEITRLSKKTDPIDKCAYQLFRLRTLDSIDKEIQVYAVSDIREFFTHQIKQFNPDKTPLFRILLAMSSKKLAVAERKPSKKKKKKGRRKTGSKDKLVASIPSLKNLLDKYPTPVALYHFACRFQNSSQYWQLLFETAHWGSAKAQRMLFDATREIEDASLPFYWLYYCCQHDNTKIAVKMNLAVSYHTGKGCQANQAAARDVLFSILETDSDDIATVLQSVNKLLVIAPEQHSDVDARIQCLVKKAKAQQNTRRLLHLACFLATWPRDKDLGEKLLLFLIEQGSPEAFINYFAYCCGGNDYSKIARFFPMIIKAASDREDIEEEMKKVLDDMLFEYLHTCQHSRIPPHVLEALEHSQRPIHWYLLGDIFYGWGDCHKPNQNRALGFYRRAHEAKIMIASFKLAIFLGFKDAGESIKIFEECIPIMEEQEFPLLDIMRSYYALHLGTFLAQKDSKKHHQRVIDLYSEAMKDEAARPAATFRLGIFHLMNDCQEKAVPLLLTTLTYPDYELDARHNLSVCMFQLDQIDEGMEYLDINIEKDFGHSCLVKASILLGEVSQLPQGEESKVKLKEALGLLKRKSTRQSSFFECYQVFLYFTGITNEKGHVIFKRDVLKAKKLLSRLNSKQQDALFNMLKKTYSDLSDREISSMLLQETLEECEAVEEDATPKTSRSSSPRAQRNLRKLEVLLQELEGKEVKWGKVLKALGHCATLTSGSITQGEGSRLNLRFNLPSGKTIKTSYHQPHAVGVKGGALKKARELVLRVAEEFTGDALGKGKEEMG